MEVQHSSLFLTARELSLPHQRVIIPDSKLRDAKL
jgi:hypothetical protein